MGIIILLVVVSALAVILLVLVARRIRRTLGPAIWEWRGPGQVLVLLASGFLSGLLIGMCVGTTVWAAWLKGHVQEVQAIANRGMPYSTLAGALLLDWARSSSAPIVGGGALGFLIAAVVALVETGWGRTGSYLWVAVLAGLGAVLFALFWGLIAGAILGALVGASFSALMLRFRYFLNRYLRLYVRPIH
jgi:hypothetical protein